MLIVITLANKPTLVLEAMRSVAQQTRRDVLHVVALDCGGWPPNSYPPSVYFNRVAAHAQPQDYVAWLSDDDVWEPHYAATLAGYLDAHPEVGACYGGSRQVGYDPATGVEVPLRELPAVAEYGTGHNPVGQIDGGQVVIRRSVLDRVARPWSPERLEECNIADGHLLFAVAAVTPIVPVRDSWVMRNRATPKSSHWGWNGAQLQWHGDATKARLVTGGSDVDA